MAETKSTTKKVKILLQKDPLISGDAGEQEFFSVNGKNILVQTDVPVEVDPEFAEVIENANKARREAREFAKKVAYKEAK